MAGGINNARPRLLGNAQAPRAQTLWLPAAGASAGAGAGAAGPEEELAQRVLRMLPPVKAGRGLRSVGPANRRMLVVEEATKVTHYLEQPSAGAAAVWPGNLVATADGRVTSGRIGGVVPTIGGVSLEGEYEPLTIADTGTVHVVAQITATLSKLGSSFVQSLTVTGVALVATGTDPGAGGLSSSSGDYAVVLASFLNGVRVSQETPGDWYLDVIDSRDGSGTGNLVRIPV